ncbi:MAG: sigma-70 family RNA polymerase sigma factor [Lachnospiraceae bacterium]|nr:sigma-70 family RNA polymerase sigma factor [Lachnospiraceae bacterium]
MEVSVSKETAEALSTTEYMTVEEVLAQYSNMVYRLAYARTMNKCDAEDITQEVFMKYMQHQHELADEEYRKAWLIRVTINASKSLLTSAWNRKRVSLEEIEGNLEGKSGLEQDFDNSVLCEVAKLPEKYRVIVHLFYFEELTVKEISSLLGRKEATIKSHLYRAREILKKNLKGEDFDV